VSILIVCLLFLSSQFILVPLLQQIGETSSSESHLSNKTGLNAFRAMSRKLWPFKVCCYLAVRHVFHTLTSREAVFSTLAAARNSCFLSILADCLVTLSYYPMLRGLF
jgi:hypothetical protein